MTKGDRVWVRFDGRARGRWMRYMGHTLATVTLAVGQDYEGKRYPLRTVAEAQPAELQQLVDEYRLAADRHSRSLPI